MSWFFGGRKNKKENEDDDESYESFTDEEYEEYYADEDGIEYREDQLVKEEVVVTDKKKKEEEDLSSKRSDGVDTKEESDDKNVSGSTSNVSDSNGYPTPLEKTGKAKEDFVIVEKTTMEASTEKEQPEQQEEQSSMETQSLPKEVAANQGESVTKNNDESHGESFLEDNDSNIEDVDDEGDISEEEEVQDDDDDELLELEEAETAEEEEDDEEYVEDDDEESDDEIDTDVANEAQDEQQQMAINDKYSLLALAAENDRVDIIKAILSEISDQSEKDILIHNSSIIPPLHIAVSYGSVQATSSLLREGCNPSIRPNAHQMKQDPSNMSKNISHMQKYDGCSAWELAFGGNGLSSLVNEGISVREEEGISEDASSSVVDKKEEAKEQRPTSSWFGRSSSSISTENNKTSEASTKKQQHSTPPPRTIKPFDMLPSKREGIRHAFTSEALRCIGSDEVDRLIELFDSGMPTSIDVGSKTLYEWSIDLNAPKCTKLLQVPTKEDDEEKEQQQQEENENVDGNRNNKEGESIDEEPVEKCSTRTKNVSETTTTKVRDTIKYYEKDESIPSLINRLEEQDSLAYALSSALDNLAEEVSVCHGLLLLGGGASALASHVRSLKDLRTRRYEELNQWIYKVEEIQDEVAYWMNEYGTNNSNNIDNVYNEFLLLAQRQQNDQTESAQQKQFKRKYSSFTNKADINDEETQSKAKNQLMAQLAASENKVRKLRASITDLSEENTRNLQEVDRRGLSGGIKLVRSLREETRDVEYRLNEQKSIFATCKTQVSLLQSRCAPTGGDDNNMHGKNQQQAQLEKQTRVDVLGNAPIPGNEEEETQGHQSTEVTTKEGELEVRSSPMINNNDSRNATVKSKTTVMKLSAPEDKRPQISDSGVNIDQREGRSKSHSEKIASGDSTAIVKRSDQDGYLPLDWWEVILRMIGLGREAVKKGADDIRDSAASTIMIV